MEGLRKHFIKMTRQGRLLTTKELVEEAKKRKLKIKPADATRLRQGWLPTAMRRHHARVKHFQRGSVVPKLGTVQIDFCFFRPELKRFNKGAIGESPPPRCVRVSHAVSFQASW